MFDIQTGSSGEIVLVGRLETTQVSKVEAVLAGVRSDRVVDLSQLQYIASAGLGALLVTQKRLKLAGCQLRLVHLSNHVRDVFTFAGFDHLFEIE